MTVTAPAAKIANIATMVVMYSLDICQTVQSSWYRFAVTMSWGRCSWMMCGSAFCGMPPKGLIAQMTAAYTMMISVRQPTHPTAHTHHSNHCTADFLLVHASHVQHVELADVTGHSCTVCSEECPPLLQASLLYANLVTAGATHSASQSRFGHS